MTLLEEDCVVDIEDCLDVTIDWEDIEDLGNDKGCAVDTNDCLADAVESVVDLRTFLVDIDVCFKDTSD